MNDEKVLPEITIIDNPASLPNRSQVVVYNETGEDLNVVTVEMDSLVKIYIRKKKPSPEEQARKIWRGP